MAGQCLGIRGGRRPPQLNWTRLYISYGCFPHTGRAPGKTSEKTDCEFPQFAAREEIQRLLQSWIPRPRRPEEEHAEFQARLASLEQETRKIVDELIAEGEAEKKKIIEAAHRQADYIQQQAHIAIQQEIQAARDSLKEEVAELSVSAAEEL